MALPRTFKLERYSCAFEFSTPHLLCCADAEPWALSDLLKLADDECKTLWQNLTLAYTESKGNPLLLKEVAAMHCVQQSDVLMVVPEEGIYIAIHCLVAHLKKLHKLNTLHVIATFPAFQSLLENASALNCEISRWTAKETNDGRFVFDINELEAMINDYTKLFIVNFPHNPTGFCPSLEEWQQLLDICRRRHIFIVSDEIYRYSNNDGADPLPSACTDYRDAVTVGGLSKTFALPGLRVGWACTRNQDVMKLMEEFKDYTTICGPAPTDILALIAMRNRQEIIQKTMNIVQDNLQQCEQFFAKHSDSFQWYRPTSSTVSLCRVGGWLMKWGGGTAQALCQRLATEAGFMLIPGEMFDFGESFVRIGFARKSFVDSLRALDKFLESIQPE